jgi:hypothetical protein
VTPGGAFCSVKTHHVRGYRKLRACAVKFAKGVRDLRLTIDGRGVRQLNDYFVVSRLVHLQLPRANIFGVSAGSDPAVVAAWFFVVHPLRPGRHTIVEFDRFPGATASLTYHIRVTR